MLANILYIIISLILMYIIRKAGWYFSKILYFRFNNIIIVLFCLVWGYLTAVLIGYNIFKFNPEFAVKIVFGYAIGAYMSIPSYGLFNENAMDEINRRKYSLFTFTPLITYITVTLAYMLGN
jgi:hypothetical protein